MSAAPSLPDQAPRTTQATSTRDHQPADLEGILRKLRAAARKEGTPSYETRVRALESLEREVLARKDAIADAIHRDFGNRSRHESLVADVFVTVSAIHYAKRNLRAWMKPEQREVDLVYLPATNEVVYQPLGVIGIIAPWNYPVQLALAPLVGAIAAGNRAMIKPSELVPETSRVLEELIKAAFPDERAVVVTGGVDVGEAFSKLAFDHLVFTGSTRVGKVVMRAAAENLVPVTLELGGKSPAIIGRGMSDDAAAEKMMPGKCFNAGQTCIAPDYALVPKARLESFVKACERAVAKMYPTLAKNPDYSSVVTDRHFARLAKYLDEARAKDVRVIELNPAKETLDPAARKLAPTLVIDPPDDLAVMQDEIFGPILPIKTYGTLDEAIAYVNDHPRPLALYYFGYDEGETERVLAETISGGVSINATMLHCAQDDMPFGGVGPSGMGHYHGREGFEAFSKKKPIFRQSRINGSALMMPPFGKLLDFGLKMLLKSSR